MKSNNTVSEMQVKEGSIGWAWREDFFQMIVWKYHKDPQQIRKDYENPTTEQALLLEMYLQGRSAPSFI